MGCCMSSEEGQGQGNLSQREQVRNEKTPLLNPNLQTPTETTAKSQREAQDIQAEKEALKDLVKKTADNLININSADSPSRVQPQEAEQRSEKLKKQVKISRNDIFAVPIASKNSPSSISDFLSKNSLSQTDKEFMSKNVEKLNEAVNSMKVKDVGAIVQSLPEL